MPDVLTTRALNRATLDRQMLLERSERGVAEATAFEIECYRKMQKSERRRLESEGLDFLRFMQAEAKSWDVVLTART